ncbi:MAG: NADH-quinone oxidoreductase subunit N [Bacteroidetes bacterium GWF2_42_66]|nr:MAG: NADH-quinone oxidoreductase subunit N [Bacteroidetes bacterium GWA2_42_15]OFY00057.1 MAG: NADH-quinone oxidoreductase subunit N [Bacteroidetes bacterium GWE2_42_39]OFY40200.1 MAG: NADH-quinone oxidoreductase subunit N [Bacteroidetes bacterium GWF2_42_66]HBL74031.1 NADH-quinone oxidoreductase subunit N [Prolixibacteraceae bacterium]HCR89551.1 NADH-quinone oxidoreductase subunit N [Prolixibacteraceae bacterium]
MDFGQFILMRHELLLILAAVIVLIAELAVSESSKARIIPFALGLFALVTIAGFIPGETGTLFGGSYQSNELTTMMKNVLNMGVLIIFLQSESWLKKPENVDKASEYFVLTLATLVGMNYMISAGDFLIFYVGLETATIPIAGLAAFDKLKSRSAEAGIKLILSSALSSGILLFGLSMIYGATGSIYFADVLKNVSATPLIIMGFIFFVAGMGFKISLVPFHFWTADVYEGAPIGVTSYLSVVSKGAAVFIFTIVLFTVFRPIMEQWQHLIYTLAVMTMTLANLFALRQDNLKRFLAFSSIAQAGFILLGILGANGMGMASVVYFVLVYVFTNLGAFGVVAAVSAASGVETISGYNGLYKTNPKLSLLMTLSLFSLAGIPPVAGFFGKFFLFTSAAGSGYFILVLIAVLNATISLYYYLRVVKAMFIDANEDPAPTFRSSNAMRLGLIMCLAGMFIIGFASTIFDYLRNISDVLFN